VAALWPFAEARISGWRVLVEEAEGMGKEDRLGSSGGIAPRRLDLGEAI